MFTGLVEERGKVVGVEASDDGLRIEIETDFAPQLALGDSVAVAGACLTVTQLSDQSFSADVMNETVERTNLRDLAYGDPVNLERALAVGDRLGGHIVQGHVDAVGEVLGISQFGFARIVRIAVPEEIAKYIVEKGSITIDGVSLTVSGVGDGWLEVSLIPETSERTTLGTLHMEMLVNLEVDILAKHVERLLDHPHA
jgi:riboflavin synthase